MPGQLTTWRLWEMRRAAIILVLGSEILSLLLILLNWAPVTLRDMWLAILFLSLCIAHSLYLQRAEGVRQLLGRPRVVSLSDMLATWTFPAAVLLPLPLVAVIVVVASIFQWPIRNFDGKATLYRYVYSQNAVLLSGCLAHEIVGLHGPYGLLVIASGLGYMAIGAVMIMLAVATSGSIRQALGFIRHSNQRNELITISLGLIQVLMWHFQVPLLWLSLVAVIAIQRQALRAESVRKTETPLPPIMSEKVWGTVAREVVRACATASVIRIDTEDPVAARSVAQLQAGCDAIGAVGANGLIVLLADCPGPNADSLALRLRSALSNSQVAANVAVAAKPRDGQVLEDLLAVTEAELITREAATRSAKSFRPDA